MKQLTLATGALACDFHMEAFNWVNIKELVVIFDSEYESLRDARHILAEYIANTKGYTLYPSRVGTKDTNES